MPIPRDKKSQNENQSTYEQEGGGLAFWMQTLPWTPKPLEPGELVYNEDDKKKNRPALMNTGTGAGGSRAQLDPGMAGVMQQIMSEYNNNKGRAGGGRSQSPYTDEEGNVNLSALFGDTLFDATDAPKMGARYATANPYNPSFLTMPDWVRRARAAGGAAGKQLTDSIFKGDVDPFMPVVSESGAFNPSWQVYMGDKEVTQKLGKKPLTKTKNHQAPEAYAGGAQSGSGGGTRKVKADDTEIAAVVLNQPYLWSEEEVAAAIKRFQDAGFTNVVDFESMRKAWGGLVERASSMYSLSHGAKKVTPWDVLELDKNERKSAGTLDGGAEEQGPTGPTGKVKSVHKTISDISEGDAWQAMRSTMQQLLGRDPSDDELRDFTHRMNILSAQNPSISTTITDYGDGSGDVSATTRTKSGFTAGDLAKAAYDDAQDDEGYAEYQAATTYFNAAQQALGQIGNVG